MIHFQPPPSRHFPADQTIHFKLSTMTISISCGGSVHRTMSGIGQGTPKTLGLYSNFCLRIQQMKATKLRLRAEPLRNVDNLIDHVILLY